MELLEQCAVIHQGIIPFARVVVIKRCRNQRHDIAVAHFVMAMKKEVYIHRADVGFYERFRYIEGKGAHCPRGVGTDAGQRLQFQHRSGKNAVVPRDNLFGTTLEIYRSPVVPQPLPDR